MHNSAVLVEVSKVASTQLSGVGRGEYKVPVHNSAVLVEVSKVASAQLSGVGRGE